MLGVCILNWNAGPVLGSCVAASIAAVAHRDSLLIVVDNCSSDSSIELMREGFPGVRVLVSPSNLGYARGNNLGAAELLKQGCTHLLFINPDVTITSQTVSSLLTSIQTNRRAGCAGGLSRDSSRCFRNKPSLLEKLIIYGCLRWQPFLNNWLGPVVRVFNQRHWLPLTTSGPVYAVSGACILFRSEAFKEMGGFDEHTFLYEEEFIVSERLHSKGWFVVSAPDAIYDHLGGHSTKQLPLRAYRHFIFSEQWLLKRYYGYSRLTILAVLIFRCLELGVFSAVCAVNGLRGFVWRSRRRFFPRVSAPLWPSRGKRKAS